MKIKGIDFKEEVIGELGRFVVLWNMFENQYFSCMMNDQKIIDNSKDLTVPDDKYNAFKLSLVSRMKGYKKEIQQFIESELFASKTQEEKDYFSSELYVKGSFYDQLPNEKKKEKYKKVMTQISYLIDFLTKDEVNICGCLFAMYRIRNNLMHGIKAAYHFSNQLDIFRSMNDVLESIHFKLFEEKE